MMPVVVFSQKDFQGEELLVEADIPDLGFVGWTGRISSIVIDEGRWKFFKEKDFQGKEIHLGPGKYNEHHIREHVGEDLISSIQRMAVPPPFKQ